jgi:hypothetical protein
MEKTLQVLNRLERDGVIERYAIAGGMAAMFYLEPILTYDLDVFVFLPPTPSRLISLSPIYASLRSAGFSEQRGHVVIHGNRVQFIPAYNELVEEAVKEAREISYGRTRTRVVQAEHLMAIMLQTGRPKDRVRIEQMMDQAEFNQGKLEGILERHGLTAKWRSIRRKVRP